MTLIILAAALLGFVTGAFAALALSYSTVDPPPRSGGTTEPQARNCPWCNCPVHVRVFQDR